ncbi:MAG: hypothetical protein KDB27_20170 [Planctomycetales bacterium]|nr:hypothetical protein [Planctomycetales bacterium]
MLKKTIDRPWVLPVFWIAAMFVGCSLMIGCVAQPPELDDAGTHFLNAKDAIEAGDDATALDELNKSIAVREDVWSYLERAQLYAKTGDDEKATADIEKGLSLDPNNRQLEWLQKEMTRSKEDRFQQNPPPSNVGK